jgi:hypothetical protein
MSTTTATASTRPDLNSGIDRATTVGDLGRLVVRALRRERRRLDALSACCVKGRRERLGGFGDLPSRLAGRGDGFAGCMTVPALRSGASDRPGGHCGRFSVATKQGARPMALDAWRPALIRQLGCTTT